jgi:Protein of unknown function (DUF1326)
VARGWTGNVTAALILDANSTEEQRDAPTNVFSGKAGGDAANQAALVGDIKGVFVAPIDYKMTAFRRTRSGVGGRPARAAPGSPLLDGVEAALANRFPAGSPRAARLPPVAGATSTRWPRPASTPRRRSSPGWRPVWIRGHSRRPRDEPRSTPTRGDQPGTGVEPHSLASVMGVEHGQQPVESTRGRRRVQVGDQILDHP